MKNIFSAIAIICTIIAFSSCEKDEGKLPAISFKTGGNYVSHNDTIAVDSNIVIGINASKSEDKDVLKKFNISKSINGGSSSSVYDVDLTGDDKDNYNYDFRTKVDNVKGQSTNYSFTVTNRDGLTNTISVTVVGK